MLYRGYTVILSSSEMCSRQSMIRGQQRVLNAATGSPMLESHMGHGSLNQKDTWGCINQHSNTWGSTYINGPNVGFWTAKYIHLLYI